MHKKIHDGERKIKELNFDSNTESLKKDYLGIFERIKSDVMYTVQYDETCETGTAYLGML